MDGIFATIDSRADITELNFLVPSAATSLWTVCFDALVREYNPVGFHESMLVRELARRAAQMIWDERAMDSFEAHAKQSLDIIALPAVAGGAAIGAQLPIAELFAPDRLASLKSADLKNSEAFFRLLRQLEDVQRNRAEARSTNGRPDVRFAVENQCIAYLVRRFRSGRQACRNCHTAAEGSWIAARKCWQCASCQTQTCIRHGTVMARSHLPLVPWFQAIYLALHEPAVTAPVLSQSIAVGRLATVRTMLTKIRAAVAGDNASELLADLDIVYFPAA